MISLGFAGNLAKDVEVKTSSGGKSYAQFTVFVDGKFDPVTHKRKGVPVRCTAWDNTANYLGKYGHKGAFVICSSCYFDSWKPRDGGYDQLDVVVGEAQVLNIQRTTPKKQERDEILGDMEDYRDGEQTRSESVAKQGFSINSDDLPF